MFWHLAVSVFLSLISSHGPGSVFLVGPPPGLPAKYFHLDQSFHTWARRCFSSSSPPWSWSSSPNGALSGGLSSAFWPTMDTMWDNEIRNQKSTSLVIPIVFWFLTHSKKPGAPNQLHIREHPPDCKGRPWYYAWLVGKVIHSFPVLLFGLFRVCIKVFDRIFMILQLSFSAGMANQLGIKVGR